MKNQINIPTSALNNLNIVVTDTDNKITYISDSYLRLMGYNEEDIIGKNPSIFKHPSVKKIEIWKQLNTNSHWNGIVKNITKNGDAIYFSADIYKDFDENGIHTGFHSVHTNITDSITNPHKFIFDNQLLELFFTNKDEYIAICLCETDKYPPQKIIEISKKLADVLGLDKEYILEKEMSIVELFSTKSKYYKDIDTLLTDYDTGENIVIQFINADNKKDMSFMVSITPFLFQDKKARVFKFINVTKEIKYAAQLNNTIKLKNNFLAHLSHEIKTPLNAVHGFLTLLQLKEEDKDKLNYINIMLNSSKHILDLSNDVIDFARIDNSKLEIVPRNFTAADIQSTIEIFFARSLEKNIELTTFISPLLPDIMSQDILRLKQVITNLISNSIKFVDEGGYINIDVHYYNECLYFTIIDNGIGMTDKQLKKVFEPFTQATTDIQELYGGTGLGLSLVKEIIDLMGGHITVESIINEGSTFSLIIPTIPIKNHIVEGKAELDNIYLFVPSFARNTYEILKKYLTHFSTANIKQIQNLEELKDSFIFINLCDIEDVNILKTLSENNKIVLMKKMNNVTQYYEDSDNITTINLPLVGSSIYNALNILLNKVSTSKIRNIYVDEHISGKLLIADDLDSNRLLINELLCSYDIELDFAINGEEAIDKFQNSISNNKSNYDLIFLDMNMPIFSGYEVAEKIRTFEKTYNIGKTILVALTANRYNTTDDEKLVNMNEYLPKPINLKHLLMLIKKYTIGLKDGETNYNHDKTKIIKDIRDGFLKKDVNINTIIFNSKKYFNEEEFKLLNSIMNISFDKIKFNSLYNKLMKTIRKNY